MDLNTSLILKVERYIVIGIWTSSGPLLRAPLTGRASPGYCLGVAANLFDELFRYLRVQNTMPG
jgi:hypothetical protein